MAKQEVEIGQVWGNKDGVSGEIVCVSPRGRGFTVRFHYKDRRYGILISQSELLKRFPIRIS